MIMEARNLPILSMLEWIRLHLMKIFNIKRLDMKRYGGSICPNIQDKLEILKVKSRNFYTTPVGRLNYEADNRYESYVVDLVTMSCSCQIWRLTGIPCKYGVVAIIKNLQ